MITQIENARLKFIVLIKSIYMPTTSWRTQGMSINEAILDSTEINRLYHPALDSIAKFWRFKTYSDILFVVDTEIATEPGVGFGVGSVIELLRSKSGN